MRKCVAVYIDDEVDIHVGRRDGFDSIEKSSVFIGLLARGQNPAYKAATGARDKSATANRVKSLE